MSAHTIREYMHAYGTSEGAEKAWDTRGRGRHETDNAARERQLVQELGFKHTATWPDTVGGTLIHRYENTDADGEHHTVLLDRDGSWKHFIKGYHNFPKGSSEHQLIAQGQWHRNLARSLEPYSF